MESWIEVQAGATSIMVPKEAFLSRSNYFRQLLDSEEQQQDEVPKVSMPDVREELECLSFAVWLSNCIEKPFAGSRWTFFCVRYCDVVQVTPEVKEMAFHSLILPEDHHCLTPEQCTIWGSVPFHFAREAIERVPDQLEQVAYAFSWIHEQSSACELQHMKEMSEFAAAIADSLQPCFSRKLLVKLRELEDCSVEFYWLIARLS